MTNNILPEVWGPHGWKFMHFVALGFPDQPTDQDRSSYQRFYESLQYVLPCHSCATHYQDNLRKYPIDLKDRDSLLRWTFAIHNEVNQRKDKPILSYEDALDLYTHKQLPIKTICKLVIFIIFLILFYYWIQ